MNRSDLKHPLLTLLSAAVVAASSAYAQTPRTANPAGVEIARNDVTIETLQRHLQSTTLRASTLIGTDIETPSGEDVGEVVDVLIPAAPGQMMQVVVATDDSDRKFTIPFDDVRMNEARDELLTSAAHHAQPPSTAQSARGVAAIIGATVVGSDGEPAGEVDDVVLSTAGIGTIRAVLQVGGVLGVGEKRIALPFDQLEVDRAGAEQPTVRVAMSLETLRRQPEFSYE